MNKLSKILASILFFSLLGIGGYIVGSHQANGNKQATPKAEKKHYTIGILQYISHPSLDQIKQGVVDGLAKEGFKDGENVSITFLNGQGDQSKLQMMSQQLIGEKPDVLIPIATPAAKAMANETKTIPIVAGAISDPVGSGLVTSLTHPSGNITGVKNEAPIADQITLLKKLLPDAKKIGVIYSANEENSKSYVKAITEKGTKAGYDIKSYAIQSSNDLAQTVQVMNQEADVIYVPQDNGIASAFQTLMNEANKAKKPVFVSVDNMVKEGGLATVGQDQYQLGIRTAKLAAKVLKEKDKTTLPFDVVSTGNVIVNEKKAKELGITIPEAIKKEATVVGGE
ncbi:tryptophan ABC transporter substrate-binding protein [Enterococcus camelliae]|uniref:Tryptophan ABC transporter substrate-binding protein n=1 Tax=Enterococcus camelliae TaxID=453959 RepID=A0ABW5TFW5_9ENTE